MYRRYRGDFWDLRCDDQDRGACAIATHTYMPKFLSVHRIERVELANAIGRQRELHDAGEAPATSPSTIVAAARRYKRKSIDSSITNVEHEAWEQVLRTEQGCRRWRRHGASFGRYRRASRAYGAEALRLALK